jgi:NAD+ kinase
MPTGRRSEDWIQSIRRKLGWNTRTKQKEFDKSGK